VNACVSATDDRYSEQIWLGRGEYVLRASVAEVTDQTKKVSIMVRASKQTVSVTTLGRKNAHPAAVEGNRPTRTFSSAAVAIPEDWA